jgi:hypothetical protein
VQELVRRAPISRPRRLLRYRLSFKQLKASSHRATFLIYMASSNISNCRDSLSRLEAASFVDLRGGAHSANLELNSSVVVRRRKAASPSAWFSPTVVQAMK